MGKIKEICVREIMGNHVYIFDGQAYLQTEGGAIGLRLMEKMKMRMMLNFMEYHLKVKYVDDVFVFLQALKNGMRWDK